MLALCLSGCAFIHSQVGESCKSRAHVQLILSDYLSHRFDSHSPVRVALIPYSVPANLAADSSQRPGVGNELAWQIHQKLLATGAVPIVEVFNRPDWPQKKDEFFTGNFGALSMAREAGYDLMLVGLVENMRATDELTAHSKLIEVESGVTVWYGTDTAWTRRPEMDIVQDRLFLGDRSPSKMYFGPIVEQLSSCIVNSMTSEEPTPE